MSAAACAFSACPAAEDPSVGLQQVTALHSRAARPGTDQQGDIVPSTPCWGRRYVTREQREGAVIEFHCGAFSGLHCGRNLEQRELHWLWDRARRRLAIRNRIA